MRKKAHKLSKIEMLDREIAKWQRAQERSLVMQRKAARLLQRSAVELARLNKKRVKLAWPEPKSVHDVTHLVEWPPVEARDVIWPSGEPVKGGDIEPGSTLELDYSAADKVVVVGVEPPKADEDIPTFLDRTGGDKDAAARAEIEAEQAEKKKRKAERAAERRKIKKETIAAELTGKRRKMPLIGKEALAAIRRD